MRINLYSTHRIFYLGVGMGSLRAENAYRFKIAQQTERVKVEPVGRRVEPVAKTENLGLEYRIGQNLNLKS